MTKINEPPGSNLRSRNELQKQSGACQDERKFKPGDAKRRIHQLFFCAATIGGFLRFTRPQTSDVLKLADEFGMLAASSDRSAQNGFGRIELFRFEAQLSEFQVIADVFWIMRNRLFQSRRGGENGRFGL